MGRIIDAYAARQRRKPCNYCNGDANDMTVYHHLPVELLLRVMDLPHDPVQRFQADRADGAQALLTWLDEKGWLNPQPED